MPVHLVIDHSVMVDEFGTPQAFGENVDLEYQRNGERYDFLEVEGIFDNFKVVPPGTGIYQVNLEYVSQAIWSSTETGEKATGTATIAYPDTLVGTDSHTTMVNGLGVLGWGVGGIEVEAAMLGQPVSMLIPEVVGFKLTGALKEGITATDLVLTVTQMLRKKGVVGRFVEFYGPGLDQMTLADRATIANMAPEYGVTCGFFPVDDKTIDYMRLTARPEEMIALTEAYAKANGFWRDANSPICSSPTRSNSTCRPSCPRSPVRRLQDKVALDSVDEVFNGDLSKVYNKQRPTRVDVAERGHDIGDGDVVIAAITSCTNTSNPSVRRCRPRRRQGARQGPEAQALGEDLARARVAGRDRLPRQGGADRRPRRDRLQPCRLRLHHLHRQFGAAARPDLGRHQRERPRRLGPVGQPQLRRPRVPRRARQLPRLAAVVAYALKGTVTEDMIHTPLGQGSDGADVFLRDVWPTNQEVADLMAANIDDEMFRSRYGNVYAGDEKWRGIEVEGSDTYTWRAGSTYVAALFRRAGDDPGTDHRHRRGEAAGDPGRQHHHPPASRPPAASRPTARPGFSCKNIRLARRTSIPTAPAAATTTS
ncbi:aconitase family protein [Sphingomonas sp. MMS24-JH45]